MNTQALDNAALAAYLQQMETLLGLDLDDVRRQELQLQFSRIATMAQPLMAYPLETRQEVAGVYRP
ncbi:oxalurate catabolism protein HpxX [Musicola paradisiaca]|uniref:Oxalurate catabolism protein HpxX n=1 Tax=Musicola paradisiaca (strain Ech703) TaxID=579405 RepID=C6CB12_MUSP7|nr:oxalurate catabolism protein HpxX [Musicola paradisiaca]ACS84712.1 conserved hypothetical protein [Musicola paradisiaca Ech703]